MLLNGSCVGNVSTLYIPILDICGGCNPTWPIQQHCHAMYLEEPLGNLWKIIAVEICDELHQSQHTSRLVFWLRARKSKETFVLIVVVKVAVIIELFLSWCSLFFIWVHRFLHLNALWPNSPHWIWSDLEICWNEKKSEFGIIDWQGHNVSTSISLIWPWPCLPWSPLIASRK